MVVKGRTRELGTHRQRVFNDVERDRLATGLFIGRVGRGDCTLIVRKDGKVGVGLLLVDLVWRIRDDVGG